MITPTFFGFNNAHRGLLAAQQALNTVNHNISNANTPGYSRQRVDLQASNPYFLPTPFGHTATLGQIGQGVSVQGVTRSRDAFLDGQYRIENSILGFNTDYRNILQQVEGILVEPGESGINASLQAFFDAAQELSVNPESLAVRQDFVQHAVDLVTVFQQQGNQLADLQQHLVGNPAIPGSMTTSELAINVNHINNRLAEVTQLNAEILTITASGGTPNDLLDRRDLLLDELSNLVEIDVTHTPNNLLNLSIAGQQLIRGARQLDSLQVVTNLGPVPDPNFEPSLVQTVNGGVDIINGATPITGGKILGIIDVAGRSTTTTTVRGTLENLSNLLDTVATQINTLQAAGLDASGNSPADPIFDLAAGPGLAIFNYSVNQNVINDPNLVAAATDNGAPNNFLGPGDGTNALAMAQLRNGAFAALGNTGFVDFFNGVTSRLGIDTRTYINRTTNQDVLTQSLDQRRESIAGVNMDEELIDLVKFQRAFEASSRTVRVFDEVIQTIINMV